MPTSREHLIQQNFEAQNRDVPDTHEVCCECLVSIPADEMHKKETRSIENGVKWCEERYWCDACVPKCWYSAVPFGKPCGKPTMRDNKMCLDCDIKTLRTMISEYVQRNDDVSEEAAALAELLAEQHAAADSLNHLKAA